MKTDIIAILDRSGSMHGKEKDTIGGFNQFLREQKEQDGEARLTLVLFDTLFETLYERMPIKDVPELTTEVYFARGCTALLDAMGRTIESVGKQIAAEPESERTQTVVCMIVTDGEENSSREYSYHQIKEIVQHQTDVYKWTFLYLGATLDAFNQHNMLGIGWMNSAKFANTSDGYQNVYVQTSSFVSNLRTNGTVNSSDLADWKNKTETEGRSDSGDSSSL